MKLDIYANYKGNCQEAFRFYERHLNGRIISMATFRQMPDEANIPKERKDDILHARDTKGEPQLGITDKDLLYCVGSFLVK